MSAQDWQDDMRSARINHYRDTEYAVERSQSYTDMLNELASNLRHAMRDARADGYAQALRDVREMLKRETDWCQECGGGITELDQFAAERGITIT